MQMPSAMLKELLYTLDRAGACLDMMDTNELTLRPEEYRDIASFCRRMVPLLPKDAPELVGMLRRHDSLRSMLEELRLDHCLQTTGQDLVLKHTLRHARTAESLGNSKEARDVIRAIQRRRK